jgi:hypothetical protein
MKVAWDGDHGTVLDNQNNNSERPLFSARRHCYLMRRRMLMAG